MTLFKKVKVSGELGQLQFLPEPGRDSETFRSLSDPAAKRGLENRKKSFIEKIFGNPKKD
jgi:hypothetical protein